MVNARNEDGEIMENIKIKVNEDRELFETGDLYGAFFEDINHAADGGLYGELLQNRSFEFDPIDNKNYNHLTGWKGINVEPVIELEEPYTKKNPHYVRIDLKEKEYCGLENDGFNKGLYVKKDEEFYFSFFSRRDRDFDEVVCIKLVDDTDSCIASAELSVACKDWTKYEGVLKADRECENARFNIVTKGNGTIWFDHISLFPRDTFKGRRNGLRRDLAEAIAELEPKFLRFPGGCLVHDGSLNSDDRNSLYRWKNTIGPVEERPARRNNWGYNQTLGLGYYEYFLFCEDIGAKPLPVVPAAYNPHHMDAVPLEELQPWIDETLDLIEFANGDENTTWGAVRAELGHKESFGLEYLAVGNEELFPPFLERFPYFYRAIREKYPEIKIISSVGPFPDGYEFDMMWEEARKIGADLVDEHYYMSPQWMLKHVHRYDSYSREGTKAFLGEYASLDNRYENALCEAAFMTGLDRNGDAVQLACYAPLLCNVDYVNWSPDMIWFDNHRVLKTTSYYVQQLFSKYQGKEAVECVTEGGSFQKEQLPDIRGFMGFSSANEQVEFSHITINGKQVCDLLEYSFDKEAWMPACKGSEFSVVDIKEKTEKDHFNIARYKDYLTEDTELSFDFEVISGKGGIAVTFGQDNDCWYTWEIGGWANDMSSVSKTIGYKSAGLTYGREMRVKEGQKHHVELSIQGRHFIAKIDGVVYHDFNEIETVIEPVYVSAAKEEQLLYVKAVNVNEEKADCKLVLEGNWDYKEQVRWLYMACDDLDAKNTFEEPERVAVRQGSAICQNNTVDIKIPARSVNVFIIQKENN